MKIYPTLANALISDATSESFSIYTHGQRYKKTDSGIIPCETEPTRNQTLIQLFNKSAIKIPLSKDIYQFDGRFYLKINNEIYPPTKDQSCRFANDYNKTDLDQVADVFFERILRGDTSKHIQIFSEQLSPINAKEVIYSNNNGEFTLDYKVRFRNILHCYNEGSEKDENGLPQKIICKGSNSKKFDDRQDHLSLLISPDKYEAKYCEKISFHYGECHDIPKEDFENQIKRYLSNDLKDPDFAAKLDAFKTNKFIAAAGVIGTLFSLFQFLGNLAELNKNAPDNNERNLKIKTGLWGLATLGLTIGSGFFYYNSLPPNVNW